MRHYNKLFKLNPNTHKLEKADDRALFRVFQSKFFDSN